MNSGVLQIVAVDDDEPNLLLYRTLLERYAGKCVAMTFRNPLEALAYCTHAQADAAVIDFDMPDLDGVSLARALHEQAHHRDLPIVMVSAHLDEELRALASGAGICAFVEKPFARSTLLNAIGAALQR